MPAQHPLRAIKAYANAALKGVSREFDELYGSTGRPSIPPEQLEFNLLCRRLLDMRVDEKGLEQSNFSRLRSRLVETDLALRSFEQVLRLARSRSSRRRTSRSTSRARSERTSEGAVHAMPQCTLVGASKGALESLCRHLAAELTGRGIRVNVLAPGTVRTDAWNAMHGAELRLPQAASRSPLGRLVTLEKFRTLPGSWPAMPRPGCPGIRWWSMAARESWGLDRRARAASDEGFRSG